MIRRIKSTLFRGLAEANSLCGKLPDCRVIAVVGFLFLLCTWHQLIVDNQCSGNPSKYGAIQSGVRQHFQDAPEENLLTDLDEEEQSLRKQDLVQLPNYQTKYIIYYCVGTRTCGGWGDRQLGIVSVYLMAMAMGRRFGIMVSKPCEISAFLRPNKVNWEIDSSQLLSLDDRYLYLIGNKEYIPLLQWADLNALYPEDVLYVTTNYDYTHALKRNVRYRDRLHWTLHLSREVLFAKVMKLLFRFNTVLQSQLNSFFAMNTPKPDMQLVCAQIRVGRNPSMPSDEPRNTMADLQVVWDFLQKFNNSRKFRIFVTTDSEEVRTIAAEKFSPQFVYNPGEIIHVDKPYYGENNVCDSVMKVIMDQYILTKCDTLLVSRSYFGENAAMMRKNKKNAYIFKNGGIFRWV